MFPREARHPASEELVSFEEKHRTITQIQPRENINLGFPYEYSNLLTVKASQSHVNESIYSEHDYAV